MFQVDHKPFHLLLLGKDVLLLLLVLLLDESHFGLDVLDLVLEDLNVVLAGPEVVLDVSFERLSLLGIKLVLDEVLLELLDLVLQSIVLVAQNSGCLSMVRN